MNHEVTDLLKSDGVCKPKGIIRKQQTAVYNGLWT